jgi:hypothetical protein
MTNEIRWNSTNSRKDTMVMGLCFLADGLIRVLSLGRLWSIFAYKRALHDCKTISKPKLRRNVMQSFKDMWCRP